MVEYIEFDGPCPLLLCLADGRHKHPVCPRCGAVAYGNISCDECQRNIDIERELTIIQFAKK